MTSPHAPDSNDGNLLQRVHQLGAATESLFNRLYQGLNTRSRLAEKDAALQQMTEQARTQIIRNRQLRTRLKERELEADRLNAILGQVSEGIILQNTEGRIEMMNRAAVELLGSQRNFWKSELGVLFNEHKNIQALDSELAPLGEAKRVEINDRIISAQIAAVTSEDAGERLGTLMILRDVTREALASRVKDSFFAHISHELITPLAPMRVASEVLLNAPDDKPPNQRMLELIGKNVDILDRLVSEMLDLSAMTSGNFQIAREPVALDDVIWHVVSGFYEDIADAQLDLTVMIGNMYDLNVQGDRKHLQWAITNLVRNAILYNEAHQHIYVRAKKRDDQIVIEVEDTGVGIADDDLPKIFNLFYRGEPRTRAGTRLDPRGLGQGLFVARTIITAHGGTLSVDSTVGEGSIFTITLPQNLRLPDQA